MGAYARPFLTMASTSTPSRSKKTARFIAYKLSAVSGQLSASNERREHPLYVGYRICEPLVIETIQEIKIMREQQMIFQLAC